MSLKDTWLSLTVAVIFVALSGAAKSESCLMFWAGGSCALLVQWIQSRHAKHRH